MVLDGMKISDLPILVCRVFVFSNSGDESHSLV